MSLSLYDATVDGFIRQVDAIASILKKGREHYAANAMDIDSIAHEQLCGDMLPLHFQINSVRHHSIEAIEGVQAGEFGIPHPLADTSFAGLETLVAKTSDELKALKPDDINALGGKDVTFVMGELKIPFTAEGFLMSFSVPNFHFHATTTYDILRMKGVALGKRDYLGALAVKQS